MRVELAQARQRPAGQGGAGRGPNTESVTINAGQPGAAAGLAVALQGRLRAARTQPGGLSKPKALRLFVEAALADEWGTSMQLDASFHDLVERTCQALEADPAQATLLAAALDELEALT